ncbi:MAG: sigma-70 family RNA polymerase sigma factor [Hyphomicrobiaceae bacterium]|nr:sigma-70 family RNA polymerase sigma factor [Hyphomicrobiaceae bacterium]
MRAANGGDAQAYRHALTRIAGWLRPIVRRGLAGAGRSIDDAEDIVQETLLSIHLKRQTWDAEKPIEPWLRAIARHKLIDHLRRKGVHDHLDIDVFSETLSAEAEQPTLAAFERDDLMACLAPRQKEIVSGVSIEGLSAREMGERLGMSEGAVRVALHRALKLLAEAYRRSEA